MEHDLFGGFVSTREPSPYGDREEGYDVAQICLNGHEVNAASRKMPQHSKAYCDDCGAKTIAACEGCQAPIRGFCWGSGCLSYDVPKYCDRCGSPFPWTESKKAAALEFFAEELDMKAEEERAELKRDLDAVSAEQPRTQVSALKIKRLLGKIGKDAAGIARDVLTDILSETARKVIFPDSK
jgi:hypothetical protein